GWRFPERSPGGWSSWLRAFSPPPQRPAPGGPAPVQLGSRGAGGDLPNPLAGQPDQARGRRGGGGLPPAAPDHTAPPDPPPPGGFPGPWPPPAEPIPTPARCAKRPAGR